MTLDTIFWAESITQCVYKTDPKHELTLARRQALLQATTAFVSILICGLTFTGIQHIVSRRAAPIIVKLIQLEQPMQPPELPSQQDPSATSVSAKLSSQDLIVDQIRSNNSARAPVSEVSKSTVPIKKVKEITEPRQVQRISAVPTEKKNDEKVVSHDKTELRRDQEPEVPKQIDIAPASKVGIQHLNSRSIELVNGRRINIGEKLPNGELLMSIDTSTGRIETDRRVIMVTQ